MEYNFGDIEKKWQRQWIADRTYQVTNDPSKPKFYVLDMFPYPSGAGLHVGHPLGYIASDIYARYKRLKGFNVLHPMGYDAFGLPAEQYAIDHGIHPAVSTDDNIANFRKQLDNIGFSFDWSRSFRTSDPDYYKWTQWIFLRLFDSWYDRKLAKARPIAELEEIFSNTGNHAHPSPGEPAARFDAAAWNHYDERRRQEILMSYRLAYCGYGEVNWCEALGTVLANDEVVGGVSERGGFPVIKKKLRQWYLRITDYADRLLDGLEKVDFSDAMKEMQTNWIGKSFGAEIDFEIFRSTEKLRVYTTRPDTIFGVDFMVVAPEHELLGKIVTPEQRATVDEYLEYVGSRSERERMAEKKITGCFTGAFAIHPFSGLHIPIWTSEYVLAGYGTGAIMAVPCGDERDFRFAQFFQLSITNIIGDAFNGLDANPTKDAILENSDFLDGLVMKDAILIAIRKIEEKGIGVRKTNYRMRDAAFSRQRYWGEPFPIVWRQDKDGEARIATPLADGDLPLELPYIDHYGPGPEGEGPLANIPAWTSRHLETNTMPGYAGSSWYFLRYMDPHNADVFCSRAASDYWGQVDLYIGGAEHAVGHLLYSRMWTKFLYDRGWIGFDEPFKRLINQGMIQGSSRFVYRLETKGKPAEAAKGREPGSDVPIFVSAGIAAMHGTAEFHELITRELQNIFDDPSIELESVTLSPLHVDVNIVDGLELDMEAFRRWRAEYSNAQFIPEDGKYICGAEVEKMSKRLYNTVNPNDLVKKYGADTYRMYEMFLGPVEQSKPWDTKGIEGVFRFLRKFWRLFYDESKGKVWTAEKATEAEWKCIYRTIKRTEDATERFSFNTGVSALMIGVNELIDLNCHKKEVLEKLVVVLAPYAPHVAEELWQLMGNAGSVLDAAYPAVEQRYLVESAKNYPIAINGKTRTELNIALDATQEQVEEIVLADETVRKWLDGNSPKKIVYVKNRMINVVV
ncbi:MAG TPA: class I tRNA ligase family protein [Puia sp.]|nr:class I tRNA ligase family protein [Puia sp.]